MVVKAWNRSGGMKLNPFLFVHWGGLDKAGRGRE